MFKILTLVSAPFGPKSEGINIHITRQSGKEKPYQIRFGPSVWAGGIPLADYNPPPPSLEGDQRRLRRKN